MSFIFNAIINAIREYLRDMSKRPLEKIEETLDISTLLWMLLYGSFPYPTAQQQIEEQIGNIEKVIEENPEQAKQGFTWLYRIGRLYRLVHVQPLWVNDLLNYAIRILETKVIEDYAKVSDLLNYYISSKLVTERSDISKIHDSLSYSTYNSVSKQYEFIMRLLESLRVYDAYIHLAFPATRSSFVEQVSLMDSVEKYVSSLVENVYSESLFSTDEVNVLSGSKTALSLSDYLLSIDEVISTLRAVEFPELELVVKHLPEYLTLVDETLYSPLQALTLTFSESISILDGQIQGYPYPEQPEISYMQYTLTEATQLTDLLKAITTIVAPILSLVSTSEFERATQINNQRKLVRTSDGTLYCVYIRQLNGHYQIYVKKSMDNGETWTDETRISTYSGMENYDQYSPCIAVDSNDNLHVVWYGNADGFTDYFQIWYAKYDGIWHTPVRISTYTGMENLVQAFPCIAVDSNDNLHVVWHGKATGYTYNQVWYAKYDGIWHTPVRISTYPGMENAPEEVPCIAVDSNDNLHVVWNGRATGYTYAQIWYAKYDGIWHTPVRISTYTGMENYDQYNPCIAVDSNDNLHVVWNGGAIGYTSYIQIWYAKYDGIWHTPVRISTYTGMENYNQYRPSIAVDSNDNLHVVWYGKATGYTDYDKVWYAKYDGSWETPECLQPTGQNRYPNIRWSRYPASNQVTNRLDYVFTEGTEAPYNIMFASLFIG